MLTALARAEPRPVERVFYPAPMGQRHVWVKEQFGPRHFPGLILAWNQNEHGEWEAFVTWDNQSTTDGQLETNWVPAERLRPASDGVPHGGTAYG